MKPLIGCTMGDPAGVGPEVMLKAAADGNAHLLILGDPDWLQRHPAAAGLQLRRVASAVEAREMAAAGETGPWVLACCAVESGLAGRPQPSDGRAALACIDAGSDLALAGEVDALVTAPVSKDLVAVWEPRFLGHTEHLARRAGVEHPIMLFAGIEPHVALLTTHLPIATALTMVRRPLVADTLTRLHELWSTTFGRSPVIGLAALNPHAGEGGRLGTEETRILAPAIADAREQGVDVRGPYPADSVFEHRDLNVVLALYHDQGTIIAKRASTPSVNVTLGLPYLRTSPDHGTAYALAARGGADATPMGAAVALARELSAP